MDDGAGRETKFAVWLEAVGRDADRDAFAALFEHFAPRIKAYMRRLGADDTLAEELTQETMLTVWRRASTYDRKVAAVSTWMFTIARNKRIDGLRRTARPEIDPSDPTLSADPEQPDVIVDRLKAAERMRDALDDLPDEQGETLRLAYYEGLSQTEIAARIETPLGTVKSRMRLALQRLRRFLDEDEGEEA